MKVIIDGGLIAFLFVLGLSACKDKAHAEIQIKVPEATVTYTQTDTVPVPVPVVDSKTKASLVLPPSVTKSTLSKSDAAILAKFSQYAPVLSKELTEHWKDMPIRSALPAQIEQETCISATSKGCWNPRVELKTEREYGFGLGQLTITSKFDNFKTARNLDTSLRDWKFEDRYDPARQLRVVILMDKTSYNILSYIPDTTERLAMMFAGYNGGMGGLFSDRRLCTNISGCDANKWFGHVEKYSLKSKVVAKGYGKSFFAINREYPDNILNKRRDKYKEQLD